MAGTTCGIIRASITNPAKIATLVTLSVPDNTTYGFAESVAGPFNLNAYCAIESGQTSCQTNATNNLCATATSTSYSIPVLAAGASYTTSNPTSVTVEAQPLNLMLLINQRPYAGGMCSTVTATTNAPVTQNTTVTFNITGGSSNTFGFGNNGASANFTATTSCTISSSSNTCISAESVCANNTIPATTTIPVSANIATISANTTTKVQAQYVYMAVGGSGVTQCLISESDGSPINCFTQDDPETSINLGSVSLMPDHSYMYLLSSSASPAKYFTCLMNESGTYNNSNCTANTNFAGYANMAFALTKGSIFAYLAGTPGTAPVSTGKAPSYCSLYDKTTLLCNQPTSIGTSNISGYNASLDLNDKHYVYIGDLSASPQIFQCDVTDTPGYSTNNCKSAFASSSGAPTGKLKGLTFTKVNSTYYAYISTASNAIYYGAVTESGLINIDRDHPQVMDFNTENATSIGATNMNNKPYLYYGTTEAHTLYYCPIFTTADTDNSQYIGGIGSDIVAETCIQANIQNDPSNPSSPPSTPVSNITFGNW